MRVTPRQATKMMDAARRERVKDAATVTYNAIASDVWRGRIPSDADFVDVISDQMRNWNGEESGYEQSACSDEDLDVFWSLSARARRQLVLEVGP